MSEHLAINHNQTFYCQSLAYWCLNISVQLSFISTFHFVRCRLTSFPLDSFSFGAFIDVVFSTSRHQSGQHETLESFWSSTCGAGKNSVSSRTRKSHSVARFFFNIVKLTFQISPGEIHRRFWATPSPWSEPETIVNVVCLYYFQLR